MSKELTTEQKVQRAEQLKAQKARREAKAKEAEKHRSFIRGIRDAHPRPKLGEY